MANIVTQADCFDEVFVEPQRATDGAGDLRHFERVGQSSPIVIAEWRNEYLCFVFEPAKGFGVEDPIAIALEARAHRRFGLGDITHCIGTAGCMR
jgi:hypothetical protein